LLVSFLALLVCRLVRLVYSVGIKSHQPSKPPALACTLQPMQPTTKHASAGSGISETQPVDTKVSGSLALAPTQRFAIAVFGALDPLETSVFAVGLMAGLPVSDTTESENERLRKHLQKMIDLVEQANQTIIELHSQRDDLLDAIRWHRDVIQLPTRPDKRLWKQTIVKWDKDNR